MKTLSPLNYEKVACFFLSLITATSSLESSATEMENYFPLKFAQERLEKNIDPDSRILGGNPVSILENPWQVALLNGEDTDVRRAQFCGGTVIDRYWIVTAAHCVDTVEENPAAIHVYGASEKLSRGGVRVEVEKIFVHPKWNRKTRDSDVALLRLDRAVSASVGIPIDVDGGTTVPVNTLIRVTGWGVSSNRQLGTDELQGVELPLVHFLTCRRPQSYGEAITPTMFCAGKKDADSCKGDSGGPASVLVANRRVLFGISSWGYKCGLPNKFGVFTKVSLFRGWIINKIDSN